MANPNPQNQFTQNHKHSAKPRKRRILSEEILRDYLNMDGKDAIEKVKSLFNHKKPEVQLGALSLFIKLVFIQPKEDEVESINDIKLTSEQHEELNKFLISKGIEQNKTSFYKELMVQTSEFMKDLVEKNV